MSDKTLREAAQLALEALEYHVKQTPLRVQSYNAIQALRKALAVPNEGKKLQQIALPDKPVAWQITYRRVGGSCGRALAGHNAVGNYLELDPNAVSVPLYAAPQLELIGEPFMWNVTGTDELYGGDSAEVDAKASARRNGGACKAIALYTAPQPAIQRAKE